MGVEAFPTPTGLASRTLSPSTTYILCAEVLIAIFTAERLVGWITSGSKEKALPGEFEVVLFVEEPQEVRNKALAANAAPARSLGKDFIVQFVRTSLLSTILYQKQPKVCLLYTSDAADE